MPSCPIFFSTAHLALVGTFLCGKKKKQEGEGQEVASRAQVDLGKERFCVRRVRSPAQAVCQSPPAQRVRSLLTLFPTQNSLSHRVPSPSKQVAARRGKLRALRQNCAQDGPERAGRVQLGARSGTNSAGRRARIPAPRKRHLARRERLRDG